MSNLSKSFVKILLLHACDLIKDILKKSRDSETTLGVIEETVRSEDYILDLLATELDSLFFSTRNVLQVRVSNYLYKKRAWLGKL